MRRGPLCGRSQATQACSQNSGPSATDEDVDGTCPFRRAGSPSRAENISSRTGSYTTPTRNRPFTRRATETAKNGMLWAKFRLPQMGSTIQSRGASTFSGSSSGPSSARIASPGQSFWRTDTICSWTSSDASVTTSRWPFHLRYPGHAEARHSGPTAPEGGPGGDLEGLFVVHVPLSARGFGADGSDRPLSGQTSNAGERQLVQHHRLRRTRQAELPTPWLAIFHRFERVMEKAEPADPRAALPARGAARDLRGPGGAA